MQQQITQVFVVMEYTFSSLKMYKEEQFDQSYTSRSKSLEGELRGDKTEG